MAVVLNAHVVVSAPSLGGCDGEGAPSWPVLPGLQSLLLEKAPQRSLDEAGQAGRSVLSLEVAVQLGFEIVGDGDSSSPHTLILQDLVKVVPLSSRCSRGWVMTASTATRPAGGRPLGDPQTPFAA
jgi:hypothetical protein